MLKAKQIYKDPVFILLIINILLVLLSYSYNSVNRKISSNATLLRQIMVAASIVHILFRKVPANRLSASSLILPALIILVALFNINVAETLFMTMTFIVPYLYIFLAVNYFLSEYEFNSILVHLISAVNLVYLYPVLTYFIFDSGFEKTNIYGLGGNSYFVSNQYGWSSIIFLTSLPVAYSLLKRIIFFRLLFIASIIPAMYLALISGNRSTLLSLGLSTIVYTINTRKNALFSRKGFWIIPLLIIIQFFFYSSLREQKGSAINLIEQRNERQFERGAIKESRVIVTSFTVDKFNKDPILWITGTGIFNHRLISGASNLGAYHNSYWEILFGCGIPVFIIFLSMMVFKPLKVLFSKMGGNCVLIIPLIIIPFFESNITGGQFLFFPWFVLMLLFNSKRTLRIKDPISSYPPNQLKSSST